MAKQHNTNNRVISYYPPSDSSNRYVSRMQDLLSELAQVEKIHYLPRIKKPIVEMILRKHVGLDVLWLNFIENNMLNKQGRLLIVQTLKLFLQTYIHTRQAKLSVFVRHNHFPHHTNPNQRQCVKWLINLYERMFDVVITHSGAEANRKKTYCPHPLYLLNTHPQDTPPNFVLPIDYYVVFGRILPYKQIERIVGIFPENKQLLIIGGAPDPTYTAKLIAAAKPNVHIRPGYINDSVAQQIIQQSNGVIITHAEEEMVVSGTFFYAMSMAKPVFVIATDFINWIKPKLDSNLVHCANNIQSLCNIIAQHQPASQNNINTASIQNNFGDAIILNILEQVLNDNHPSHALA